MIEHENSAFWSTHEWEKGGFRAVMNSIQGLHSRFIYKDKFRNKTLLIPVDLDFCLDKVSSRNCYGESVRKILKSSGWSIETYNDWRFKIVLSGSDFDGLGYPNWAMKTGDRS